MELEGHRMEILEAGAHRAGDWQRGRGDEAACCIMLDAWETRGRRVGLGMGSVL